MLGGSSAINAEAWIPPSAAVVDAWESMGNPGWNWSTLAPYYRKSHTLILPDPEISAHLGLRWVDEQVKGKNGPVQVSFLGVAEDPMSKAWNDSFKNLQHEMIGDPFSGRYTGGYSNPSSVSPTSKTRSYAVSAYLEQVRKQNNLTVMTETAALRIIFDTVENSHTAQGVEIMQDGKPIVITARKEVVLATGTLQSPKLLELSGIGSRSILNSLNVHVSIDNPNVGENLQDHLMTGISFEVKEGVRTRDPMVRKEPDAIKSAMNMYAEEKKGQLCLASIGSHAFMPMVDSGSIDGEKVQDALID